jgi:hypothetical protein
MEAKAQKLELARRCINIKKYYAGVVDDLTHA